MTHLQVICLNTTESKLKGVAKRFNIINKLVSKSGHFRFELEDSDPSCEILMACRECAYAYLRLVAWERGGGFEATGHAVCVGGLEGEPLTPVVLAVDGECANKKHALFGSRSGLVVAEAQRAGRTTCVQLTKHSFSKFNLTTPSKLLDESFDCSSQEWLSDLQTKATHDQYLPLVRAVLRKVECTFCSHCHYRSIDEDGEK